MLRITCRTFGLLNTIAKCNGRILVSKTNCTAVIRLPQTYQQAFFSDQAKGNGTAKSPLGTLIQKEAAKEKQKEASEDQEKSQAREASWRKMKYTLLAFGLSFVVIGGYLIFQLGKPPVDEYGTRIRDEFSDLPWWRQYLARAMFEIDYYKRLIKEPSRDKLLPDVMTYPYYQPPYTLVLELTDVLVHPDWTYKTGWRFKKRPGVDSFLEQLSNFYEIVVYTAEQGMTVFPIIEALDPKNCIAYKLVRDATHFVDGVHVKSLDKLNRDLRKVIVVDWNATSVKFHPDNLFHIPRWDGNDDDTMLLDLTVFLKTVAQSDIEDVREVLKYYSQFDNPVQAFRDRQKKLMEQQEAEREAKQSQNPAPARRWSFNFLNKPF